MPEEFCLLSKTERNKGKHSEEVCWYVCERRVRERRQPPPAEVRGRGVTRAPPRPSARREHPPCCRAEGSSRSITRRVWRVCSRLQPWRSSLQPLQTAFPPASFTAIAASFRSKPRACKHRKAAALHRQQRQKIKRLNSKVNLGGFCVAVL